MARILLRSGNDFARSIALKNDGQPEVLTGYTIKAAVKNNAKDTVLIPSVAQSPSITGADWANGIVVIFFSAGQTAGLQAQNAFIEVDIISPTGIKLPREDTPIVIETRANT